MKRSVVLYCPLCFFLPMVILLYIFVELNLDVRNAEEKFDSGTSRHSPSSLDAEGQLRTAQKSGGQQGQGLDLGQGQSQKSITFPPFVEEINEIGAGGKGVEVNVSQLTAEQKARYDQGWQNNSFNQYLSDMMSVHRPLPRGWSAECRNKTFRKDLPEVSVIIIFHNEAWSVLLRSVHSVLDRTPSHLLREVILVDDLSTMGHLKEPLDEYWRQKDSRVKVVHSEKRIGLTRARLLGYRASTAPMVVFFDSHIECFPGWLEPLADRIVSEPNVTVYPSIETIIATNLQVDLNHNVGVLGIFRWRDLTFTWGAVSKEQGQNRKSPADPIKSPTMPGGLFAISRDFFDRIGAYDPGLDYWGGENIELSFKAWMCYGSVELVPCSHVGHIFRTSNPIKWERDIGLKNVARVAHVWMDDYKNYFLERNAYRPIDFGDVSDRKKLREELKCRDFAWFLKNVQPVAPVAQHVLHAGELKAEAEQNLCLDSYGEHSDTPRLYGCHGTGGNQFWAIQENGEMGQDDKRVCEKNGALTLNHECHDKWNITSPYVILALEGNDVYMLCNGVYDCPFHEDEDQCEDMACPGLYRCRGATVCLHVTHVCDGWSQCRQNDDEYYCNLTCPLGCVCHGHSYQCKQNSPLSLHPQLRFLHASGSGIQPDDLASNTMLIYLNLARCNLTHFGNTFPNLRHIDLSFNHLKSVNSNVLTYFPEVTSLSLAGNPIAMLFHATARYAGHKYKVQTLDLSFVEMKEINPKAFRLLPSLQILNLSHCNVHHVQDEGFQSLPSLEVLDVRGCPLTSLEKLVFHELHHLRRVFADNYKLCCPTTLPKGFVVNQCLARSDEISSCDALLRSDLYRISLAIFATLALVGNPLSFVLRVFVLKGKQRSGYTVFVTHLCLSDFMMGVYLMIIGGADRFYLNTYLWEDTNWKNSVVCKMAGFLSLLSTEVSASIICLVTVDRFLVVQFPFSRLRFERRSAKLCCLVLWTIGIVLAAVPLLPATSSWHFYSQTGICIPLPVTRKDFPGDDYAFGVMIVFNFVLFVLIAVGQFVIYLAVRGQSMTEQSDSDRRRNDVTVAQRLFAVVVSDFVCWFPIGLLGLLASRDIPISGEVNVGLAIFVLPLNSALNPFLYSLSTMLASRDRAKEQKLLRMLKAEATAVN